MRLSPEWKRPVQFGITFEISLVLVAALPLREIRLSSEAHRLLIFSHYPLLWLLDIVQPESAVLGLGLLLGVGLVRAAVLSRTTPCSS